MANVEPQMTEIASQTFHMVSRELGNTVQDARNSLEEYIENPSRLQSLSHCADCLHVTQGVLRMVEIYGAALLTEEMEQVTRYLLSHAGQEKTQTDALDALTRAMVQLPTYLDRVQSGGRDIALVLLPLLNDLRAVRGHHLLSEGTLMMLNLHSEQAPLEHGEQVDISKTARSLRPRFQSALLGWIKGQKPDTNLKTLAAVAERLEITAANPQVFQLWWVVGGVVESLREGGLETSVSLKRLLAQADRQIKVLIDKGESNVDQETSLELLNNLLYYVARSTSRGKKVSSIRSSFQLAEVLPADEQIEVARESLSAPSVKLMKTVAAAIKEDLTQVKDILDIYVRTGKNDVSELTPQLSLLKKISDTLGVLGLGDLRSEVQLEIKQLHEIVGRSAPADDSVLVQMAATLLRVEDCLDDELIRLILPLKEMGEVESELDEDIDFRQVAKAVVRECIINLARVKEAVTQALADPQDSHAMDKVPYLLRGITAALLMLGKTRAVGLVERIGRIIGKSLKAGEARLSDEKLDRLADAIVSVEYYMETVQSGRSDPWYMLDNAQSCLEALEGAQPAAEIPVAPEQRVAEYAKTVHIERSPEEKPVAQAQAAQGGGTAPPPVVELEPEKPEAEFLELFIEEAKEEIASIQEEFPKWRDDGDNAEALAIVRRSFHTLKGSGRMVGADTIGEFAWSIEDLLNRLINSTLTRTDEIVEFVGKCVDVLPALVEQLETGADPQAEVESMKAHARSFAQPEMPPDSTIVPQLQVEPARPEPPAETWTEEDSQIMPLDPVLQEIFTKESAGHLQTIKKYLEECRQNTPPHEVTETLHRSCHTLNGSANMAGVEPAVKVAEPLNRYVRKLYDNELTLSEEAREACEQVVLAFDEILQHINESTGYFKDHGELIARFDALEVVANRKIAEKESESAAYTAEVPVLRIDEPAKEQVEEPGEVPMEASEFDREIAAIFSEEASELLEATDEALAGWMGNPDNMERIGELKRHLHTLKGGARMAGITTMGDLSHDLESLFIRIQAGDFPVDQPLKDLLQASVDELHRMRDLAAAGQMVPAATALVARIEQFSKHGEAAAEVPAPAEVQELTIEEAEPPVLETEAEAEPAESEKTPVFAEEPPVLETEPPILAAEPPVFDVAPPVEDEAPVLELEPPMLEAESPVEAEAPAPESPMLEAEPPMLEQESFEAQIPTETPESVGEAGETETEEPAFDEVEEAEGPVEEEIAARDSKVLDFPSEKEPQPLEVSPPEAEAPAPRTAAAAQDVVRVNADLLEQLLNNAGEITIFRSRLEQTIKSVEFNLAELAQTVMRLKDQLRKMEIETEAQILHRHQEDAATLGDFDPLEMDRYSMIQQLSRALAESVSDVGSLKDLLDNQVQETGTLLTQQARVTTELQDGLMRTRMVPFDRYIPRLSRIVRQAASETRKRAQLTVNGTSGELDRQVLENMLPSFEHLLRNAVIHGVEAPERRTTLGKPEVGRINVQMQREGSEVVIQLSDDGAGLDIEAIKRKARQEKLILPGQSISDDDAMQLVLEPGFSTAREVTQAAGRGVGMDVVATEITKLGGSLKIDSVAGKGATFIIRLPFTLAISQALIVRAGEEMFALPLPTVEAVVRVPKAELERRLAEDTPVYDYGGDSYLFRHLGPLVGGHTASLPDDDAAIPIILVRAGEHSTALVTDEMLGSREIVVKSVGPQISVIRGISGATILGDGSVVIILDVGTIVRTQVFGRGPGAVAAHDDGDRRVSVMVVDDSITVRRVTQRLLERHGMRVTTAKDGVDAVSMLQEHHPDVILLDIEMPRMDGYEVAAQVRNDERLKDIPIIMVTSRVGEKHRARAIEVGVNNYLGKPYQENQLLEAIEPLVRRD